MQSARARSRPARRLAPLLAVATILAASSVAGDVAPPPPAAPETLAPVPPRSDDGLARLAAVRTYAGLAARPEGVAAETWEAWVRGAADLRSRLDALQRRGPLAADLLADAEAHWRNLAWLLRYEETVVPEDAGRVALALRQGTERAAALAAGPAPWTTQPGTMLRGFVSAIDGSVQPYGLIVPARSDPTRPIRLDVVLHGSMRPRGGAALRFCHRFAAGTPASGPETGRDFIELHPLGRVENGYRWAGETDIFEAIEAVCRQYAIDRRRIVLRGFSMGASGTWHVGLKQPDRFAALGPYTGYVDTYRFSASPNPRFVRVADLPPHQAAGLHLHDAVDYAANAGIVPVVAATGELDPGSINHTYMAEALAAEGLPMVNLVAPGTAHRIDPATLAQQLAQIAAQVETRAGSVPRSLRFVTWTLKYGRCHWLELRRLARHYERTEIAAALRADGVLAVTAARNVDQFALDLAQLGGRPAGLVVLGQEIRLPPGAGSGGPVVLSRVGDGWRCDDAARAAAATGKAPGRQGPIDDAFTGPFLCVRGTGAPWQPRVQAWADASLRRFAHEWARYMGGALPVKDDTDVTEEDRRTRHLVLFGDPGSNRLIREALPQLPVRWTRESVGFDRAMPAANHAPVLICASPLPGAEGRYLVLNSGHTFHEPELSTLNYLLYPRLGDWALVEMLPGAEAWSPATAGFPERILQAGFFDESWRLP